MEKKKRNKLILILAALLLLLALIFGLSRLTVFKQASDMNVVETQDNSFSIPSYDENQSHIFNFLPAEDGKGEITYKLISAKDSNYKEVGYFSLVNEKDTRILVEKGTPAGTYTLTIRAHDSGNGSYKAVDKDIIYLYTIGKAQNGYFTIPQAAQGLVYNGDPQALATEGQAIYGTIMYKLDDGEWSEEIPTATEAGIYTVSYKVVGDKNHDDVDEQSFMVVIEQQNVGYKPGFSFGGNISLGNLLDYIRQKAEDAASSKIPVSGKPETLVEYTYDGNVHDNNYHAPAGIEMVGEDHGVYAGTYVAIYTPDKNHCWSDRTRTPVTVILKINRAKLVKPSIDDTLVYTGKTQSAILENFDEQTMTVVGNTGKNAGEYHAIIAIKDKLNYEWDDSTTADLILEWHIARKDIRIPSVTTVYTYKATALLDLPVVQFVTACDFDEFDEKLIKIVSGYSGALAGDYQVRLALKDKNNYAWEDGDSSDKYVGWTINRKAISDKPVDRTVTYNGKIQDNGYDKPVYVRSRGSSYGKNVGEYIAYYKPYDNYCWSDGTYDEIEVRLTIEKAVAQIVKDPEGKKLTYNGSYQQLISAAKADAGKVLYKVDSEGSIGNYTHYIPTGLNAGVYTVYYKAEGDDNHYQGEEKTIEVVINKAEPKILTSPSSVRVEFDGNEHNLIVPGYSDDGFFEYHLGSGIYFSSIPRASEAGEYTVYVRFIGDRNHKDKDEFTLTSKILAKRDPRYAVEPEIINSVYDGKAHDLISSGSVDEAVGKIMFSLDNEKWSEAVPSMTNAGTYDVYYMIKGSDNYEDSEVSKKSATISKADFEVANNDQEYDYDGMAHGRGLSVTTVDQSTPSVTYSFEGSSYSEAVPSFTDVYVNFKGEVIIRKINYRIEAENFNTAEGSYTVLINRVDPTYVITYPELIYDGNMHKLIEASVEGGKILYSYTGIDRTFKDVVPYAKDAGEYTFYYRIDGDMNHNDIAKVQVSNTIRKAEIHVEVGNNTFAYNGQPQGEGISAYTDDDTDVVIRYGLSADKCWSSMVPKISNVDESRIIYYEVKAADHEPVTGSYMLEITPVAPEVTAPEKIEGLFYTGSYQNLITAGSSKDGTMMYKVDSEGSIGNYTTYIPTGKNAKEYTVSYYCAGDANHTDSEVGQLTVFIDMNNRVHLALSENEGEMEAGSEKDVEIDTNSNGTLSCESSSANVSCSIDDETKTLHIETAQEAVGEIVTITVRVTGGNYADHSVAYTLTVKSKTGEEEVDVTPAEENSEENAEVTPAEGNDEEPKPEMANVSSAPDLVVQNESDEQSDKQEPVDKQPDIMEEINKVVIAEAKAEITSMQILSQYDMYGEPVSYFTRDGRLIKPQKDTPAGRYTVEVKVTIEFEVDEDGNTKIIMIDTANKEVSRQSDDSGSSKPAYVEVQDENKDEEEEIVVPEMINEQPVLPEVVQDENDNSDDDILNNNDLNPIYEPQNEPIINQEDGSDNENEETNETDITE